MSDLVDELLARDDISADDAPDGAEVDALVATIGSPLPQLLLKLWRAAERVELESIDAELVGLAAAIEMAPVLGPEQLGFLPLLDTHQSNYVGVMVREPLAPRVGLISHDDGPEGLMLRYRDVDGFLRALIAVLDRGENADLSFYDDEGDYPLDGPRTAVDYESARTLLATDGSHGEWNWAIGLLDATNLAEWERLLETRREVRCDVLMRLRQMSDPAIRDLLARDERAMQGFAEELNQAAREAGLKADKSWCDYDAFFSKRNRPDAMRQIVAWFKHKDESIFRDE
jgi:hypothetical protein